MGASLAHQEKMYRAYMEFFDIAERKRRWHPLNDIPWEKLNPAKNSEEKAICVETFCGVELYVPDYTANGFNLTRTIFGHAWFQANWGYEESKHGLTFREYLIRSGQRTEEQYADFEQQIFAQVWNLPFHTRRQMSCYGALQESATFLIYRAQMEKARQEGDEVLDKIYFYVSRDEAAHMGFYIKVLQLELEEDREGTLADLAHVIYHFQMPGVGLIPEYDQRLGVDGVGISSQQFLQRGIFPLLKAVGTSRQEIVKLLHEKKSQASQVDTHSSAKVPIPTLN
ncbi:acyl-ACP desaturase [Nostoc commune]|uniref:acyl-ACP desaturase n=1 Tax=Nostoc commune TaxID=1178 RepID=UPI0018C85989|nr:acyl-ACP desaturase [Nostoc commune]MBG1261234.1 acyl-ACP desaturase [Nostoc commune BAE]